MSTAVWEQALALPEQEREALANRMLASLPDQLGEAEFLQLLRSRLACRPEDILNEDWRTTLAKITAEVEQEVG